MKKKVLTSLFLFFLIANVTYAQQNTEKPVDLRPYNIGFNHIGIPTSDLLKTLAFYEGLGFELIFPKDRKNLKGLTFVQLGNTIVELIPRNGETAMKAGAVDHFCIQVRNIEEIYNKMKEGGYTFTTELKKLPNIFDNGESIFKIVGPNKEIIEFCEIY